MKEHEMYHEPTLADDGQESPFGDPFAPDEERPTGRHPLNVTHLVMGIAFLGLLGTWGAVVSDLVQADDVRWLLPVPWVLAGLAGLLAIAFGGRRSRQR